MSNTEEIELKPSAEYCKVGHVVTQDDILRLVLYDGMVKEIADLKRRLGVAVEALEFYADEGHWSASKANVCPAILYGEDIEERFYGNNVFTGGKRAREALASIGGEGEK